MGESNDSEKLSQNLFMLDAIRMKPRTQIRVRRARRTQFAAYRTFGSPRASAPIVVVLARHASAQRKDGTETAAHTIVDIAIGMIMRRRCTESGIDFSSVPLRPKPSSS